ncbi:hypothetical protein [Acinetobacter puyangensis]|uniref:hypothetical protein n=1 Tax=Acinetobacter puyangensis TaxID=1096779 RepID=UPI003A4DF423
MTSFLTIYLPELDEKAEEVGLLESEWLIKLVEQAIQAFCLLKSGKASVPVDFDGAHLIDNEEIK